MSEIQLPALKINTLLLRIEKAIFVKEGCKFDKKATIEIEKNGKKLEFYTQPLEEHTRMDYTTPVKKTSFESVDGTYTEPLWTTGYFDDYTNGDVWVPLDNDRTPLTIKVKSNHFVGYLNLDISKDKSGRFDYDLSDEHGKRIETSSLRLSYEWGTHYEIEFRTGDENFAPGTGTDPLFMSPLSPIPVVFFANFYKTLKRFNPFGRGQQAVDKGENTTISFQINGLNKRSRFYSCIGGEEGTIELEPKRKSHYFRYRFFVPSQVGTPLSLALRLVSGLDTKVTWFLDSVTLRYLGSETKELFMPCYQWITEGRVKTISLPYGILPQTVANNPMFKYLQLERANELEVARSKYQWDVQENIPSYMRGVGYGSYDLIPLDEKFDDFKNKDISYLISKGLVNAGISYAFNQVFPLNHIEDYTKLYHLVISKAITKPTAAIENWTDDAYYGWTFLAGTNPLRVNLIRTVPSQFLKEKDLYKDLSGNPIDLEEEARQGRIYMADYSGLAKYNMHTEGEVGIPSLQVGIKYSAPAVGLFYVGSDGKIRPIAIQLIPDGVIFTPRDEKWQWIYAKMALRNADAQYHQVSDHWLHAHAVTETFSIALQRAVSRVHPLYRLLVPHLKYTIGINTIGRRGLANPGGLISMLLSMGEKFPQLLVDEYARFDFSKMDLISTLESQGFTRESKGAVQDFPYYDDGILVWDAMFDFVGKYLALYYHSNEDVQKDTELANWIKEIRIGNVGHVIKDVTTIAELQKWVASLIWNVSCHHSVVNFNQFNTHGFVPNYPTTLYRKIPTHKEEISEKFIMESLPGPKHAAVQILAVNTLSSYADNEEYLTSSRYVDLIGEEKAKTVLETYRKRLFEIDTIIKKRNEERVSKGFSEYKLLMPTHVPNSVAI